MLRELIQNWWLLHLRGILAVIFGGFLLFLAGTMRGLFGTTIALVGVMLMFVLYLICSGVLSMLAAFKSLEKRERFWAAIVHGVLMLVLGLWLFFSNELTLTWLIYLTVANAFASGILEVILARAVRRHVDATALTVAGVISLGASIGLILARNAPLSELVSALGVYAIFYGAVLATFSFRLHAQGRRSHLLHMK
jgi:uncharacterized membrane protein HdeD (DUF308 family)